jgi:hypothetical protein
MLFSAGTKERRMALRGPNFGSHDSSWKDQALAFFATRRALPSDNVLPCLKYFHYHAPRLPPDIAATLALQFFRTFSARARMRIMMVRGDPNAFWMPANRKAVSLALERNMARVSWYR